jgi:hypothetical protein
MILEDVASLYDDLAAGIIPARRRLRAGAAVLHTVVRELPPDGDLFDAAAGLEMLATDMIDGNDFIEGKYADFNRLRARWYAAAVRKAAGGT